MTNTPPKSDNKVFWLILILAIIGASYIAYEKHAEKEAAKQERFNRMLDNAFR